MTPVRRYPTTQMDNNSYDFAGTDLRPLIIVDTRDCPGAAVSHGYAAAIDVMKAAAESFSRIPKAAPVPKVNMQKCTSDALLHFSIIPMGRD